MVHDEVKEALRSELYKRCIDEADVTEEKIVYLLRKLGYTNFRDHAPQLWRYFTKQAPLRLTPQQVLRLRLIVRRSSASSTASSRSATCGHRCRKS